MTRLAVLTLVGACAPIPDGARVLTGEALQAELSGQRIVLPPPPEDSGFADGVLFTAELRDNGVARLAGTLDGEPIGLFDRTKQWQVRGQTLCIHDGPQPSGTDCARIDWIGNGQFRINNAATGEAGTGTYAPI
jgi:hypothetical protein